MLTEHKLGVVLSKLEEHPSPKYMLEQYSITPGVAAHMLFMAKDDLKGRVVYDLGCGTGRLAIGAAMLGAKTVVGIDIDRDALAAAERNARYAEKVTGIAVSNICRWVNSDIFNVKKPTDTVIQFPPFELGDMFFKKALGLANVVYSIHKSSEGMEREIKKDCKRYEFRLVQVKKFDYKLAWKEGKKVGFEIMLVVAKRIKASSF